MSISFSDFPPIDSDDRDRLVRCCGRCLGRCGIPTAQRLAEAKVSCMKCDRDHPGSHPWCQPCRDRVNKVYEAEALERARAEAEELSAATYDSVAVSRARELLRVL